jgi:hypothetical protein
LETFRKTDYTDRDGETRRVLLPANGEFRPEEGIPADMQPIVEQLYADATPAFRQRLWAALWRRNLIEPEQYLRPESAGVIRSALLEVLRYDALDLIAKAKEIQDHE